MRLFALLPILLFSAVSAEADIKAAIKEDRIRIRDQKIAKILRPFYRKTRKNIQALEKEYKRSGDSRFLLAVEQLRSFEDDERTRWEETYDQLAEHSQEGLHARFKQDLEFAIAMKEKIDLALAGGAAEPIPYKGPYRDGIISSESPRKLLLEISAPLRRLLLIQNGVYTVAPNEDENFNGRILKTVVGVSTVPGLFWGLLGESIPIPHMIISGFAGFYQYVLTGYFPFQRSLPHTLNRVKLFFGDRKKRLERSGELKRLPDMSAVSIANTLLELSHDSCFYVLQSGGMPNSPPSGPRPSPI